MEFRILGPLEVVDTDRSLPLGGPRQRALLAILLLHRNEPVAIERLVDELWGDKPPATGAKTVHVYVSRLRKTLGEGVVLSRPTGYLLRLQPGQLDLDRFEALVSAARESGPAGAAAKLREALSLWRGPPLADFVYESFAQNEIASLEERRIGALEQRVEADLSLGRNAELVAELEALVARHPLRERLRGQLMLALYRSGRQADALATYQEARRTLAEELGLEPSPTLQLLQGAILRQDASLEAPVPNQRIRAEDAERRTARGGGVFVGRDRELGALVEGLEAALAGSGRLVLVSGEPGIGKSRLADELASCARELGAEVLVGRCWEAGGAPAYWPWVQALRTYVRGHDREMISRQLGPWAADLAQIVPELREFVPDASAPRVLDPEAARFRLFDATASFLRSAGRERPLVLVLDDLHAADVPSLLLLEFVAAELADSSILIVAAFRDVDPTLQDPLASTLAEVTRRQTTRLVQLTGFGEAEVGNFIQVTAGLDPPAKLISAIHRQTEGNPLFVGEVVRLRASEGSLSDAAGYKLAIPQGVRAVIGRRLRRLPENGRRILSVASVLGREFSIEALELVIGLPAHALLEALDEPIAARVISEVPGAPAAAPRLRFSHALIRDVLYEELSPSRRLELHREVGEALERLYARETEPHLAELAHHFAQAAAGRDVGKTIDYARRAGERAVRLLAYEEAVRLFQLALDALGSKGAADETTRCDLLLALGDAQARAGDEPRAKETFLHAAELARGLGAWEQLARAALGYGGRFVWARAGRDRQLVPLLEGALAGLGQVESPLRVRVLARLAGALRDQHEREPRAALSLEALEMARRIGDPATLAYALDGRCMATFWPENPEERIAIASELAALAEEIGDRERAAAARYYGMMFQLELGQTSAVRVGLDAYAALAEDLQQPAQLWLLVVTRATFALFEGRFAEAENLIEEALALGQHTQGADALLSYRIQLFTLRWQRGELAGLEEMLARSAEEYPARPMLRCMLALLYTELNCEADARRVFEELAADDFRSLPRTNEWLFSLGFLADVAAYLADPDRARTLYELLSPYAARNASTADYISTGSVSRPLGVLAATLKQWQAAERHFEDALVMNAAMGARPWVAHTQHDYARMLLARDPAERQKASLLLASCLETFSELAMERFAQQVSRLAPTASASL